MDRDATLNQLLQLAVSKIGQQEWPKALEILEQARKAFSKHPDVLHLSGLIKFHLDDLGGAEKDVLYAINGLPNAPAEFHNNLANIQRGLGKVNAAEVAYRQALKINPKFSEAYTNLGKLIIEAGRWDEAIEHFKNGESYFPNDYHQSFQLGRAYQYSRRLKDALAAYQRCIDKDPEIAEAFNNLGNIFYDLGEKGRALQCYEQALKLLPEYIDALHNLGSMLPEMGRAEEGIFILNRLVESHPHLSAVWSNLADAMLEAGRNSQLRQMTTQFISGKPKFLGPRLALSELLMMEHSIENALKLMLDDQSFFAPDATDRLRFAMLIRIAICGWMLGRHDLVAGPIKLLVEQCKPINRAEKNFMVFAGYLSALLQWIKRNPLREPQPRQLLLLGDSHALSACGQTVKLGPWTGTAWSRLIMGCKAFHLASVAENKYKASVRKVLNEISPTIPIILCVGEIDCRMDEGVLVAFKKGRISDIETSVDSLVNDYVSFVQEIARSRGLSISYQGVPTPTISLEKDGNEDIRLLLKIIDRFNQALQKRCETEDVFFVDVGGLTCDENGINNRKNKGHPLT
jgi:tetratricopeptide (TPR) repeat protein